MEWEKSDSKQSALDSAASFPIAGAQKKAAALTSSAFGTSVSVICTTHAGSACALTRYRANKHPCAQ